MIFQVSASVDWPPGRNGLAMTQRGSVVRPNLGRGHAAPIDPPQARPTISSGFTASPIGAIMGRDQRGWRKAKR